MTKKVRKSAFGGNERIIKSMNQQLNTEQKLKKLSRDAEQLFEDLSRSILSVKPGAEGAAVIMFSLSKVNAFVKRMLGGTGIDIDEEMSILEKFWKENIEF